MKNRQRSTADWKAKTGKVIQKRVGQRFNNPIRQTEQKAGEQGGGKLRNLAGSVVWRGVGKYNASLMREKGKQVSRWVGEIEVIEMAGKRGQRRAGGSDWI